MQRQKISEDDDFTVGGILCQGGGNEIRRRHQAVNVLMVLVQHHAVKTKLVGIDELINIFLIKSTGSGIVPQTVGHGYPTAGFFLVEIFGEIWICHEVPAKKLNGLHG
jgi:hypothetical protein